MLPWLIEKKNSNNFSYDVQDLLKLLKISEVDMIITIV